MVHFALLGVVLNPIVQGTVAYSFLLPSTTSFQKSLVNHPANLWRGNGILSQRQTFQLNVATNDYTAETVEKKAIAVDVLQALLEKQKKEVRETETLIEELYETSDGQTDILKEAKKSNASEIALSIYSGFNYGFISRSQGCASDLEGGFQNEEGDAYGPPSNFLSLGSEQFMRNFKAILGEYKDEEDVNLSPKAKSLRKKLKSLTLSTEAIWEREQSRGPIVAPLIIKIPYLVLCYILDVVFEGRYVFSRFFLLETVARMPYMSYITMLHFYETLGFWRRSSDIKRIHFAEEWNEFHHLLIMESLGGDQSWWVRFMAQHSAFLYFGVLTLLWAVSPTLAYKFSELLETHAVDTYGQFVDENEEILKTLPPSLAAIEYYTLGISDPLFGEYQTAASDKGEVRKPGTNMRSLYDVFSAIRNDEEDHVKTMQACLDPNVSVMSPSLEKKLMTGLALGATVGYFFSTGDLIDLNDIGSVSDITDNINLIELIDEEAGDASVINSVVDGIVGAIVGLSAGLSNLEETEIGELALFEALLAPLKQFLFFVIEIFSRL